MRFISQGTLAVPQAWMVLCFLSRTHAPLPLQALMEACCVGDASQCEAWVQVIVQISTQACRKLHCFAHLDFLVHAEMFHIGFSR
jgi:hypothetical protein